MLPKHNILQNKYEHLYVRASSVEKVHNTAPNPPPHARDVTKSSPPPPEYNVVSEQEDPLQNAGHRREVQPKEVRHNIVSGGGGGGLRSGRKGDGERDGSRVVATGRSTRN